MVPKKELNYNLQSNSIDLGGVPFQSIYNRGGWFGPINVAIDEGHCQLPIVITIYWFIFHSIWWGRNSIWWGPKRSLFMNLDYWSILT